MRSQVSGAQPQGSSSRGAVNIVIGFIPGRTMWMLVFG